MKAIKAISLVAILAACFYAGLYGGPLVRGAYKRLFPPPAFTTGDFRALYKEAGKPVVLFSTSTCPFCKETRELFVKDKISYKDYLIDKSKDAKIKFIKLGGSSVPMIYIGNRKIVGFSKTTIENSLAQISDGTNKSLSDANAGH